MRTATLNDALETATAIVEDNAIKNVTEIMEIIAACPACNDGAVLLIKWRPLVAGEEAMTAVEGGANMSEEAFLFGFTVLELNGADEGV